MNTLPAQEGLLVERFLPPPLPRNYIALSPAEPLLTSYDTYWGVVAQQRGAKGLGEDPGYLVYDTTSVVIIFYTAEEILTSYDQVSRFLPALLPYCDQRCGELVERARAAQRAYVQEARHQLLAKCRAYIAQEGGQHGA